MSDPISKILHPLTRYSANNLVGQVTLAYFVLYTGFNKETKFLDLSLLYDFFTTHKRGLSWTLAELNKLISLAGISTMLLAFIPGFERQSSELLWSSMWMLRAHTIYSFGKFYDFSVKKVREDKPMKQSAVALGVAAQASLTAGYILSLLSPPALYAAVMSALSLSHFTTMEMDYKYRLGIRPFAYLPFVLAIPVFLNNARIPSKADFELGFNALRTFVGAK